MKSRHKYFGYIFIPVWQSLLFVNLYTQVFIRPDPLRGLFFVQAHTHRYYCMFGRSCINSLLNFKRNRYLWTKIVGNRSGRNQGESKHQTIGYRKMVSGTLLGTGFLDARVFPAVLSFFTRRLTVPPPPVYPVLFAYFKFALPDTFLGFPFSQTGLDLPGQPTRFVLEGDAVRCKSIPLTTKLTPINFVTTLLVRLPKKPSFISPPHTHARARERTKLELDMLVVRRVGTCVGRCETEHSYWTEISTLEMTNATKTRV